MYDQPGGWPFYGFSANHTIDKKLKLLEKTLPSRSDGSFLGSDSFDKKRYKEMIREWDAQRKKTGETYGARDFIHAANESFFSLWLGGRYNLPSVKYVAFHSGSDFYLPANLFFNVYPDGYIIQPVRDPRAVVASRKHFFINRLYGRVRKKEKIELRPDTLKREVLKWIYSILCAYLNQEQQRVSFA